MWSLDCDSHFVHLYKYLVSNTSFCLLLLFLFFFLFRSLFNRLLLQFRSFLSPVAMSGPIARHRLSRHMACLGTLQSPFCFHSVASQYPRWERKPPRGATLPDVILFLRIRKAVVNDADGGVVRGTPGAKANYVLFSFPWRVASELNVRRGIFLICSGEWQEPDILTVPPRTAGLPGDLRLFRTAL